jgi:hypothetical protein
MGMVIRYLSLNYFGLYSARVYPTRNGSLVAIPNSGNIITPLNPIFEAIANYCDIKTFI